MLAIRLSELKQVKDCAASRALWKKLQSIYYLPDLCPCGFFFIFSSKKSATKGTHFQSVSEIQSEY
ncbi:hypothetical protein WH47_07466 [Habropoda laboriosa]|uniref:Uncharacterized protein n=1 Tax=Habropoda laboriosa TaxID=597456 RepID=A0A0L7QP94_9HYME|nr:hypothetical protein WH47_07466 [Habropoda laboriosa]